MAPRRTLATVAALLFAALACPPSPWLLFFAWIVLFASVAAASGCDGGSPSHPYDGQPPLSYVTSRSIAGNGLYSAARSDPPRPREPRNTTPVSSAGLSGRMGFSSAADLLADGGAAMADIFGAGNLPDARIPARRWRADGRAMRVGNYAGWRGPVPGRGRGRGLNNVRENMRPVLVALFCNEMHKNLKDNYEEDGMCAVGAGGAPRTYGRIQEVFEDAGVDVGSQRGGRRLVKARPLPCARRHLQAADGGDLRHPQDQERREAPSVVMQWA